MKKLKSHPSPELRRWSEFAVDGRFENDHCRQPALRGRRFSCDGGTARRRPVAPRLSRRALRRGSVGRRTRTPDAQDGDDNRQRHTAISHHGIDHQEYLQGRNERGSDSLTYCRSAGGLRQRPSCCACPPKPWRRRSHRVAAHGFIVGDAQNRRDEQVEVNRLVDDREARLARAGHIVDAGAGGDRDGRWRC